MKIYTRFPKEEKCLICGTNENKESCLIPLIDIGEQINRFSSYKCGVVHLDCLNLFYDEKIGLVYQKVKAD